MRVLVTGASSFEGNAVISELLERGYAVVGVSRTPTGIEHARFTWHCMDLSDDRFTYALGNLSPADDSIGMVVHCAPARFLSVVRNAVATHTGLIFTGQDWRRGWAPVAIPVSPTERVHVATP